ncbi:MAG TPA: methyltransferase domain-containing protein [Acidimicrobiales bacterium]|nr:methyltransferase domain-containing protein [Acidimicrobiales bacterium]
MNRSTVEIYEQAAGEYEARRKAWRRADARAFGRGVTTGGVRVDLGCGGGRYTKELGRPVVAVDAARAMLELTRSQVPACLPVQADLERLPFRDGSVHGAWSNMAYHHFPRERLPMALASLHWATAVGAPVDITVVHGAYAGTALPMDDFPGRYFACWEEQPLADIVIGAGFDVETVEVLDGRNTHVRARRARSLPDTVGAGMRVLVCGLNPSEYSADRGVGYARPGNRFWPAALQAKLVTRTLDPVHALMHDGVGITDLAKRATVRASDLHPDEYRAGLARVERLVAWLQPRVVCFVGLDGWRTAVDRKAVPGRQPSDIAGAIAYVMPSTSGLNARTSLAELTNHLRAVKKLAR